MEEICSQIRGLHLQFPRSAIWFAGDANFPDIKRDRNTVCGNSYKHQSAVLRHHSWYRIWTDSEISHTRKNTLDLFVTNRPSLIYMCKPLPGLSGHDIAFVEAKVLASRKKDLPVKHRRCQLKGKTLRRHLYKWELTLYGCQHAVKYLQDLFWSNWFLCPLHDVFITLPPALDQEKNQTSLRAKEKSLP